MKEVDYWEAWSLWFSGTSISSMKLWFWQMLTWGRVGKILQFTAGLMVILDIIGPSALNRLGRNLKRSALSMSKSITGPRLWQSRPASEQAVRPWGDVFIFQAMRLIRLGLWAALTLLAIQFVHNVQFNILGAILAILAGLVGLFIARYINFAVANIVATVVLATFALLALLLSRAAGWGQENHPARWIAFLVFCIGFHFDLLAS